MLRDLVLKNRSYRRFAQHVEISRETLLELVDLARLTPSGMNRQPLKYFLSAGEPANQIIFTALGWAGCLKDWDGPAEGEKPSAYIVMVKDTSLGGGMTQDEGIAAQTIMLGAVEKGLGGCIIFNVNRAELAQALKLPAAYEIVCALALGKPVETVVLEEMKDGDVKYWRDERQIHHVPKRPLGEILL